MGLSLGWANAVLNQTFRAASAYVPPEEIELALMLVEPVKDGTGGTEADGDHYDRLVVANDDTVWDPASTAGQIVNKSTLEWAAATADLTIPGTNAIVAIAAYDHADGTTFLGSCTLSAPQQVLALGVFTVEAGDLVWSIDPAV